MTDLPEYYPSVDTDCELYRNSITVGCLNFYWNDEGDQAVLLRTKRDDPFNDEDDVFIGYAYSWCEFTETVEGYLHTLASAIDDYRRQMNRYY